MLDKEKFNRKSLLRLTDRIIKSNSLKQAASIIRKYVKDEPEGKTGTWKYVLDKLAHGLTINNPNFSIISLKGNSKLPFASFSSLPKFTCPGAGDCLNWCYSFTSWQYPSAWARQLQNTLLLWHSRKWILEDFLSLPKDIIFRLYVDGDFDSKRTVKFWFDCLRQRPDIKCYGYSKSWDLLHWYNDKYEIPPNYLLNLSSGGKTQKVSKEEMLSLKFVRGEFIAVPIDYTGSEVGFKKYEDKKYHDLVRQAGKDIGSKFFSCPGACGTCANGSHACGNPNFSGIRIAIGIH